MDQDVLNLLITGALRGSRREFGRDVGSKRPLLLHAVMQGRRRESHCRLLQMPAEILADIVNLLADDKAALASLALVNSDCRYLASSCQFAEIHFDYSCRAQNLLVHLAMEAKHKPDATTRSFPIGVCVRRFTFASRSENVTALHPKRYDLDFSERSQEQRRKLGEQIATRYKKLRDASLLAICLAMPNLEVLVWRDSFTMDRLFFESVSRCSARHIELSTVRIDKPWLLRPPLTPAVWPLHSLDLDVRLTDSSDADEEIQDSTLAEELDHPMSDFFKTLFQRCASTLEWLSWGHMDFSSRGRLGISLGSHPPAFPRLRYLQLGFVNLRPLAFSSLLASSLRHLELPARGLETVAECLVTCEPLRDLQSLVIPVLPFERQACMHVPEFLRRHKHVRKLLVYEDHATDGEDRQLDRLVIPVLAEGGFDNLCCLSLAWGADGESDWENARVVHIPETALMVLGTIVSLERLSLRAGFRSGWRNQWLIDHDKIRNHLRGLRRLKMLVLSRDTYSTLPYSDINTEQYYVLRLVGAEEYTDARARAHLDVDTDDMAEGQQNDERAAKARIWERAHRNRMLTQAEAYAQVFPELEWVFCGQWPMGFERHLESHVAQRRAIPLAKHRDESCDFFHKTFEISQV